MRRSQLPSRHRTWRCPIAVAKDAPRQLATFGTAPDRSAGVSPSTNKNRSSDRNAVTSRRAHRGERPRQHASTKLVTSPLARPTTPPSPAATIKKSRAMRHPRPQTRKGAHSGTVGAGAYPGAPGNRRCRHASSNQTPQPKPGTTQSVTRPARTLNHRGRRAEALARYIGQCRTRAALRHTCVSPRATLTQTPGSSARC